MAYNEDLADRIRDQLEAMQPYPEKRMFGGIAFFLNGNMACGVSGDELMVRVGPERYEEALAQPYARPFDITGRPMTGWVMIASAGCASETDLKGWVQAGVDFALKLPPK